MEERMRRKIRIQLTEMEVWLLRNLLAQKYHRDRRNLRYRRKRIEIGSERDSATYPVAMQENHLERDAKLLKKLSRHVNVKWFIQ